MASLWWAKADLISLSVTGFIVIYAEGGEKIRCFAGAVGMALGLVFGHGGWRIANPPQIANLHYIAGRPVYNPLRNFGLTTRALTRPSSRRPQARVVSALIGPRLADAAGCDGGIDSPARDRDADSRMVLDCRLAGGKRCCGAVADPA